MFEMHNVRFIENNNALDYLLISEIDSFKIVSINIIDLLFCYLYLIDLQVESKTI